MDKRTLSAPPTTNIRSDPSQAGQVADTNSQQSTQATTQQPTQQSGKQQVTQQPSMPSINNMTDLIWGNNASSTGATSQFMQDNPSYAAVVGGNNAATVAQTLPSDFLANNPSFSSVAGVDNAAGIDLKSGLAQAGITLGVNYLGDKIFGEGGGAGAAGAYNLAVLAGANPILAGVAALVGGKIFGDDKPDNSWFNTFSGDNIDMDMVKEKGKFQENNAGQALAQSEGAFGKYSMSAWEDVPGDGIDMGQKLTQAITSVDDQIASYLTPEQVETAKQSLEGRWYHTPSWRTDKSGQAKDRVRQLIQDRYATVLSGLGLNQYAEYIAEHASNKNAAYLAIGLTKASNEFGHIPAEHVIGQLAERYQVDTPEAAMKAYISDQTAVNSQQTAAEQPSIERSTGGDMTITERNRPDTLQSETPAEQPIQQPSGGGGFRRSDDVAGLLSSPLAAARYRELNNINHHQGENYWPDAASGNFLRGNN